MKNLLQNATDDCRRLNPHLFNSNDSTGNVAHRRGIRKGMNRTEAQFARILDGQKHDGYILSWKFEPVKLKIGEGCWYCPDFMVLTNVMHLLRKMEVIKPDQFQKVEWSGIKFIEVKGFLRDDARVKFLAAQEQHKWATFEMWSKDRKLGWRQIL